MVADAPNFGGGAIKRCQMSSETPLFVCFRTKSDVHPVCTKSLSEKPRHNLEQNIFDRLPNSEVPEKKQNLESGVVLLCYFV